MLTRRTLLHAIGRIAGSGAVFGAMHALGIAGMTAAHAFTPPPPSVGRGRSVVVLGAGMAGLTAAYELEQAGFLVTLLEARDRVGGRAWTLRDGDKVEMIGEATQTMRCSDGLYLNAGPARIPSFHQGLLGYARKFGVTMEVEVNSSRSAYVMGNDGQKIRMRTAINDTRGHIAELLAKALNQGALDQSLSLADKQKLLPFLQRYGDLRPDFSFAGTERSGLKTFPGAGVTLASHNSPLPLEQLLANEQLPMTLFEDAFYMQATMVEPVGGMDMIHRGFDRHLRHPAIRGAEVTRIRQSGKGVEIVYRDVPSNAVATVNADYLICTIPFPVLKSIDSNFSPSVKKAIAGVIFDNSNKIAFEAPRFWEAEQIYGGISFVGGPTSLIWYPSAGLHTARGILLACYGSGAPAVEFAKQPIAEQIEFARGVVDRLHPGHGASLVNGIAVNWSKVPYSLGPWPNWLANRAGGPQEAVIDTPPYRLLQEADGRVYFASAALSQTPGWQEGAIQSAQLQVLALARRAAADPAARLSA